MTWPANLSDRDMAALFPQFMKVEAERDPVCSVEVHGEDLTLFVPGGPRERGVRGRGAAGAMEEDAGDEAHLRAAGVLRHLPQEDP